ncbi:AT-rich interactive domain-containing protein 5B-like [Salvelinus fontinalis]|uniref:AT-rich interactive domain-containing protein 5B-like n=1 Tax=Salvelinus fontinalis TaxID=8038 RepID=UPI0024853DB8|nr:AT-rich interactive domain-containing protein 5B-like [Salvelinus fontinalis]
MEQNAIQWLGAPSCLRGSFAFYKSVSCEALAGAPALVWKLGEFYYVRCGPQEPVCIAEVTLLWEDQAQRHLLASSRLYFLPEDTPKGRTREHGEDEVLAVSKKIVVRVEDLVRWTCPEPPGWKGGSQKSSETNSHHKPTPIITNGPPASLKEKGESARLGVKVLSYPQYCRFRSLQRRIQDGMVLGLQDPHLLALGGIRVAQHNTRVLYCRDTFNHPTLDSNTSVWTQLGCTSLSLKGRPLKRRGRPEGQKAMEPPALNQSESWIERITENVMGSVEMQREGGCLPHPEEQMFLDQLYCYMERCGSPISKVPNLGFKKIDLFVMYSVVKQLGGHERVTSQRLWKKVYNELGGCPGSTSAATCTRRHYERLILPYEEHRNGGGAELKLPASSGPTRVRGMSGRRPLVKGRGAETNQEKIVTPTPPTTSPDGVVVVKRGRGRPPGKKNQVKLLVSKASPVVLSPPAKPSLDLVAQPPLQAPSLESLSVLQRLNLANLPLTPDLSPMSAPFLLPKTEREVKMENGDSPAPSPTLYPATFLPALPRLHTGGSFGGFSPTKGLCTLDLFRSRLGLTSLDTPGLTPQNPASHQPSSLYLQAKTGSPNTTLLNGNQPHPQSHHQSHHQCWGCGLDEEAQRGGSSSTREVRNSRPPLPPLRVLPLDLDCSLQVRQLMRTRLGSAQLHSFTKRLSEVLAQDLSSKPHLPVTPPPEQALPLNLSKCYTTKRSAFDETDYRMSSGDQDNGDSTLPLAKSRRVESCDEAEDLSSPSRARAFILELPQHTTTTTSPDTSTTPTQLFFTKSGEAWGDTPLENQGMTSDSEPAIQVKVEEDLRESSLVEPEEDCSVRTKQAKVEERETVKMDREEEKREEVETVIIEDGVQTQSEKDEMEGRKLERIEKQCNTIKMGDGISERVKGTEDSLAHSASDSGGQQVPMDDEEMECDVGASIKGLPSPILPPTQAQPSCLNTCTQPQLHITDS